MKKLLLVSSMCLAGISAFALPDYDPFADASGSGETTYTVGSSLIGQTNAQGLGWFQAGPNGAQPMIVSGNLSVAGLASSGGNSVSFGGTASAETGRLNLGSATGSGTVYFSMAISVTALGSLPVGGAIVAGFNNTAGTQTTQPGTIGTPLELRLSGTGYNIGMAKAASQTISWDSGVHTVGETVFVVGSYTFNAGANLDTAALWINPDLATFGAGTAPTATLTATAGNNLNAGTDSIASFLLRDGSTSEPTLTADDLRVGLNWADVTPPTVVPEPASLALGGFGILALVAGRRFARK